MTTARSRPALRLAAASAVDLSAAIDAFLSQPDLAPTTRAKYRQTLAVVEDELGDAPVTGTGLAGVVEQRWHHASPATWNRHVATVRSFARYCERTRILEIDGDVELQRRAEKHDHTRSILYRAATGDCAGTRGGRSTTLVTCWRSARSVLLVVLARLHDAQDRCVGPNKPHQLRSTDRRQQRGHSLLHRDGPRSDPDNCTQRDNHASPTAPALVEEVLTTSFTIELPIGRKSPQRFAKWSAPAWALSGASAESVGRRKHTPQTQTDTGRKVHACTALKIAVTCRENVRVDALKRVACYTRRIMRARIRYTSAPYAGHLVRTVERDLRSVEIKVQQRSGEWGELVEIDTARVWLASPGARRITIAEYLGPAAQRIRRYGEWVEIPADVARSHAALLRWCRHHANSELPSGAFRLAPKDWERHSGDELDLPFLPEFDHPEGAIRHLAAVEAKHRDLEMRLQRVADLRRKAIAAATSTGHSRRSLGGLIGLSYARIQQLLTDR